MAPHHAPHPPIAAPVAAMKRERKPFAVAYARIERQPRAKAKGRDDATFQQLPAGGEFQRPISPKRKRQAFARELATLEFRQCRR